MTGLIPPVDQVAADFQLAFPAAVINSGLRSLDEQASAMAADIVLNRQFIAETYLHGAKLQLWVDANPDAVTQASIALGLLSVLNQLSPAELRLISRHLTGEAFDVLPATVTTDAKAWLIARAAELGGRVLFSEGGLPRVHFQV